jgi:hypothetical protein
VDVSTLQGETLGRVNMSKIKPYHEPLQAKAYVLEVGDVTNSSFDKTNRNGKNGSNTTNHHNGESSYSEPYKFYKGERMIITPPDYDEMHYKILECYFIHPLPKDTLKVKSTNGVLTMKNQWWNTKLPTKINYCKEKSPDYLLENSHQYTLCKAIIKDDTHDKYKTAKKFFNHNKVEAAKSNTPSKTNTYKCLPITNTLLP